MHKTGTLMTAAATSAARTALNLNHSSEGRDKVDSDDNDDSPPVLSCQTDNMGHLLSANGSRTVAGNWRLKTNSINANTNR